MMQVEFEPEIEEQVRRAAEEQHITESALMHEVMLRWLEDREDYARGIQSLLATKHTISLEEMQRLSDVAD